MDIGKISQSSLANLYFGGYQLVEEKIVTGSALTSYTFSGLNGDMDEEYRLVARVVNGYNGDSSTNLRLNNDSTAGIYGYQELYGDNTDAGAYRGTAAHIGAASFPGAGTLGYIAFFDMTIQAKSGYVRTGILKTTDSITGTTVDQIKLKGFSWNNTVDNITSIVVLAEDADGLGVGTHLLLFKKTLTGLAATTGLKTGKLNVLGNINAGVMQKIYDNTLAAAAQSVNITGLNGDVDTIYELKIRGVLGGNSIATLISPNSDTTSGSYGTQNLRCQNTTVSAFRNATNPGFYLVGYGNGVTGNIYVAEGLIFAKSGYLRTAIFERFGAIATTTVDNGLIAGFSWTNTAANITSILIDSQVANGWGIGSHFELWCLKKKI